MSAPPVAPWQPPKLARPAHGLLARHGWLWLAVPGGVLFIASLVAAGILGSKSDAPNAHSTTSTLIGFGLMLALALLLIGLPVRAVIVHRHRRHWAPGTPLPSLSGRFPTTACNEGPLFELPPAARHHQRRGPVYLVLGGLLGLVGVAAALTTVVISASALVQGINAQRLQHSSSAQRITATLDRDTEVSRGRGVSYTDIVTYTVGGHTEHGVQISADGAKDAGDTISVLVEPGDPTDAIATSDHGYGSLVAGSIASLVIVLFLVGLLGKNARQRRHAKRALAER